MPLSTVSAVLTRIGLGKRSRLEPPEPPNRYERARPGELLHVDVKKLGRIGRPGHRVNGDRRTRSRRRRRLGVRAHLRRRRHPPRLRRGARRRESNHRGRLPAPRGRPLPRLRDPVERVMTDNGPCYRAIVHALACKALGISTCAPGPTGHAPTARPTLHPHPARRLGVRRHLRQLRRAPRSPRRLARLLQSTTTTRLPRPPTAATAAGGAQKEQPGWVLQLADGIGAARPFEPS